MPYLGQYTLSEQLLGTSILPNPIRPISRHRVSLGTSVRKSLLGTSFPKNYKYKKEITYQISHGTQQRKRYAVPTIPVGAPWAAIWFAWRTAVALWKALSPTQKHNLNIRARTIGSMSGFNLYIREYIRANY